MRHAHERHARDAARDRSRRRPLSPTRAWHRDLAAVSLLLALAGVYFTVLELREPYYFLCDDNASFYLPSYAYNEESVFGRGEIPHLNYHQYLGHTYLASGQTSVLYPPLYLGLALTRLGWGDPLPIIDVLVILHFALAALGMYLLLRRLEIGRAVSVAVSFLWMSFPFLVVVARSWIFVSYTAAYLPWGLLLLERLLERPEAPRVLALAAVKALFIYQGYVQYVILATLFEGVYLGLRWAAAREARDDWRRQAFAYGLALAATGALAAPLLLPMLHAKQVSAYRTAALSFDELVSNALSLGTLVKAQFFGMDRRAVHQSTGAIFYVGLPNLLALGALAAARRRWRFAVPAAVALLALVFSTRAYGLMHHVPLFSSFRWPFKSFLICLFFSSVALAGAYESLLSRRGAWRPIGVLLLAAAIGANVAIVLTEPHDTPFGPNRVEQDVASLRAAAAQRFPLDEGRVVSMWMSPLEPEIHRLLIFNYATLVGAFHLGGYDPLIARENLELAVNLEYSNIFRYELTRESLDYLSSWSVRFLVIPAKPELRRFFAGFPQLRLAYRGDGLEVWENAAALPFAYFPEPPVAPVEVTWGTSGVRLATGGRGGWLRVGIAPLAWYEWTADGREMGPVDYDEARHVVLEVPEGTREVTIRYADVPFKLGTFVFLVFALSVAATWVLRRRKGGAEPRPPG